MVLAHFVAYFVSVLSGDQKLAVLLLARDYVPLFPFWEHTPTVLEDTSGSVLRHLNGSLGTPRFMLGVVLKELCGPGNLTWSHTYKLCFPDL